MGDDDVMELEEIDFSTDIVEVWCDETGEIAMLNWIGDKGFCTHCGSSTHETLY